MEADKSMTTDDTCGGQAIFYFSILQIRRNICELIFSMMTIDDGLMRHLLSGGRRWRIGEGREDG